MTAISPIFQRTALTEGWTFSRSRDAEAAPVRLPHDAMLGEPRSATARTGNHGGFFPGGRYVYTREWAAPADIGERDYRIFFEGVYGLTTVRVNGVVAATCESGYRGFFVPLEGLEPGQRAVIEVDVDNSATPNSRWYTGSGIYRPVWLESTPRTRIADDGITLTTRSVTPESVTDIEVRISGESSQHRVRVEVDDAAGSSVTVELPVTGTIASGTLRIPSPRPWSAEDPHLYTVTVQLTDHDGVIDERRLRTGLRTIQVDPVKGLLINGNRVLLRGACVHHDNGVLGAVSLPDAEHRRARILKENGFNAIRSSHNPLSPAFLDACDEVGLYVIDELTDVWFQHKTPHDSASRFDSVWREDAAAMVAEDRNRPSVIMYSIGNEIAESQSTRGITVGGEIHSFLTALDPTRPTTIAVNVMLNLLATRGKSFWQGDAELEPETETADTAKKKPTSTAVNAMAATLGKAMQLAILRPKADMVTKGIFGQVDVAGYNYAYLRYAGDRRRHPDRVILGTESMPGDLPSIWRRVTRIPGVIGDFMWTGWDYLGEAGIGAWAYDGEPGGLSKPYPALLSGAGAIDILGLPGAPALLARAVWGELDAPAIAVRPLNRRGPVSKTPWRTSDAVQSWSWHGLTGSADIEVYAMDDQVELILNGRPLGRKRAGARVGYVTRYRVEYEPGELVAIGYRNGRETGRSRLRSAGPAHLSLRAETIAVQGADALAYIWVELADSEGIVESAIDDIVRVTVTGPGELAGLGNAALSTTENYTDCRHTTYQGRALAVIRGTGSTGTITVAAESARHGSTQLTLSAL